MSMGNGISVSPTAPTTTPRPDTGSCTETSAVSIGWRSLPVSFARRSGGTRRSSWPPTSSCSGSTRLRPEGPRTGCARARHREGDVRRRHALRHHHRPGVENKCPKLRVVDGIQMHPYPVVPKIRGPRHHELLRVGMDERAPHLPGESESHQRLICGEGKVDDSPDAKLDAPPDQRLVAARQTESHLASRVHRCHCASRIPPRAAPIDQFSRSRLGLPGLTDTFL